MPPRKKDPNSQSVLDTDLRSNEDDGFTREAILRAREADTRKKV